MTGHVLYITRRMATTNLYRSSARLHLYQHYGPRLQAPRLTCSPKAKPAPLESKLTRTTWKTASRYQNMGNCMRNSKKKTQAVLKTWKLWTNFGPIAGQLQANCGSIVGQFWGNCGPIVGQLWANRPLDSLHKLCQSPQVLSTRRVTHLIFLARYRKRTIAALAGPALPAQLQAAMADVWKVYCERLKGETEHDCGGARVLLVPRSGHESMDQRLQALGAGACPERGPG